MITETSKGINNILSNDLVKLYLKTDSSIERTKYKMLKQERPSNRKFKEDRMFKDKQKVQRRQNVEDKQKVQRK